MFHPDVIAASEARLTAAFGHLLPGGRLTRHAPDVCQARIRQLADARDAKGRPRRPTTPAEDAFILNEQLVSAIDYAYWSDRYAVIAKETQDAEPIAPRWASQTLFLRRLAALEADRHASGHPDGVLVNVLKARQLGLCLAPETRVLTAALQWQRIDSLAVGTELVATDEFPVRRPGRKAVARRMRTARVEAVRTVDEPAYLLRLDTGVCVIATGPHRWLARQRSSSATEWRHTKDFRVGDAIRFITRPWGPQTVEDGWIAGMLDGEGSFLSKGVGAGVCIAQAAGAVYDRVCAYLTTGQYVWREEVDRRSGGTTSKFGKQPVYKAVVQRMDDLFRLLGRTRPTRFIGRRWWEGKELPGKCSGIGWARIVQITAVPAQRMIDIQTSTKTFIAEGLVSHNSTEIEVITAHRATTQPTARCLVAADVQEQARYLMGMAELVIDRLPWWLRPDVAAHQRGDLWRTATGALIRTAWGKSARGGLQEQAKTKGNIGRGKTFTCVHLSEYSTWERPEQIRDGLIPGIPTRPRTFAAFESTAKGRYDAWHSHWLASDRGATRFTNIFIPWYIEPDKYWLPAPDGWTPLPTTTAHIAQVERTSARYLLGETVRLSKEQAYWYERTRASFEDAGELFKFFEEYPATFEEAFQHAGRSIFNSTVLARLATQETTPSALLAVQPAAEIAQIKAWEKAHPEGA